MWEEYHDPAGPRDGHDGFGVRLINNGFQHEQNKNTHHLQHGQLGN
jgi:hypothetical protein